MLPQYLDSVGPNDAPAEELANLSLSDKHGSNVPSLKALCIPSVAIFLENFYKNNQNPYTCFYKPSFLPTPKESYLGIVTNLGYENAIKAHYLYCLPLQKGPIFSIQNDPHLRHNLNFSHDDRYVGFITAHGGHAVFDKQTKEYVTLSSDFAQHASAADIKAAIIHFAPQNSLLALGFHNGTIQIWNTSTWKLVTTIETCGIPNILLFSNNAHHLLTVITHKEPIIALWNLATSTQLYEHAMPNGSKFDDILNIEELRTFAPLFSASKITYTFPQVQILENQNIFFTVPEMTHTFFHQQRINAEFRLEYKGKVPKKYALYRSPGKKSIVLQLKNEASLLEYPGSLGDTLSTIAPGITSKPLPTQMLNEETDEDDEASIIEALADHEN
jgi:WD40 repeat protein